MTAQRTGDARDKLIVWTDVTKRYNADEIEQLETHKFEEINTLFWRNSNLNFNNKLSLIKSLEEKT